MSRKRERDNDNSDFVNVLRQRAKQDEAEKLAQAQRTFELLMSAQLRSPPTPQPQTIVSTNCWWCDKKSACEKCSYCEHNICSECTQPCSVCAGLYCSRCSIIDHSSSVDQVFCPSCKQGN